MPWQLIYTSAPRGLASGQSGFCTVARSPALRDAVALRLEQLSSYHYLQLAGPSSSAQNPTISVYRILDIRGAKFYALTRLQPCGLDFTARTNHLAQHLVFQPEELVRLPSPAAILRHWKGWLSSWQGDPRLLDPLSLDSFKDIPGPSWPAKGWLRATGDAGRAAGLLESEYVRGCYLLSPAGGEQLLLELFCETLQLPNFTGKYPLRTWQHTFTTFLQAEDATADFQWRGCRENTPAWEQAVRRSVPLLQLEAVRVPDNPLAKIAREGLKPPAPAAPAPRAPLTLKKEPSWRPAAGNDFSTRTYKRSVPRPSNTGGRSISISLSPTTLLKGVGVVAVLALLLLGVNNKYVHLWQTKPGATPSGVFKSKTIPANLSVPAQKGAPEGSTPPPTRESIQPAAEAKVPEQQLETELQEAFKDLAMYRNVPSYLLVAPAFDGTVVSLARLVFLEDVLQQVERLRLPAKDIEMRYDQNSWGLQIAPSMGVSWSADLGLLGQVPAAAPLQEARIRLTRSGLTGNQSTDPSVQVQITTGPLWALSVLCKPVGTQTNFQAFRLLVLNESNLPVPLQLNMHCLNLNTSTTPGIFSEPLQKRLRLFQPVGARWQLRPRLRPKDGSADIDVLSNWPGDLKPQLGDEVNLTSLKDSLEHQFETLTNWMAELDKTITTASAAFQTNVELGLPLGEWFGLTNSELASFEAYRARFAPKQLPALYINYLDSIAGQAAWIRDWPPATDLKSKLMALHDHCVKHFKKSHPRRAAALTLQGPIPNYFQAAWQNLRSQETQIAKREEQAAVHSKLDKVKARLELIPSRLDQLAGLSLCVVGPNNKPLEMIRFSNPSGGK